MNDNHDEEHGSFLSKLFSKKGEPSNQNELEQVIHEASENDVIDEDTEDMIQGIFDINRLRVSDVMIPSSVKSTLKKYRSFFRRSCKSCSRTRSLTLPCYQ